MSGRRAAGSIHSPAIPPAGRMARVELLLDVLNALNDTAEEGLASDTLLTEKTTNNLTFGVGHVFVDPRRAMVSIRLTLGR